MHNQILSARYSIWNIYLFLKIYTDGMVLLKNMIKQLIVSIHWLIYTITTNIVHMHERSLEDLRFLISESVTVWRVGLNFNFHMW